MSRVVPLSIIVGALAFLVAPASARVTPKSTTHTSAGAMQAMMPECSAMMNEFMADPMCRKRMMAIMQKHMMQHHGQRSMMMMQHHGQRSMMMMLATAGAKAMQSDSAGSDSCAHEAHHTAQPAAMATAAAVPSPTPSPVTWPRFMPMRLAAQSIVVVSATHTSLTRLQPHQRG